MQLSTPPAPHRRDGEVCITRDGEMKTTGMPETVGWAREQEPESTVAAAPNLSLDPVLVQFLCQAGLDPT